MLETKLHDRLREKLAAEDERAKEKLVSGNLTDIGDVREAYGRRKALADAQLLLDETFEDIMKE